MKKLTRFLIGGAVVLCNLAAQPAKPPAETEMRPLGLVGGVSWLSTVDYYQVINKAVNNAYGNNTNPPLLVFTLNQRRIHELQAKGDWSEIARLISDAVARLAAAGAQGAILCSNTAHMVYGEVAPTTTIPILHIADATGQAIRAKGLKRVGLIGTKFTMEERFYLDWLMQKFEIESVVPDNAADREELTRIIQRELAREVFKPESKAFVLAEIAKLQRRGVEGIVLGCTEFPLIIKQADVALPVFDTTALHAEMAVRFILRQDAPAGAPAKR